MGWHAAYCFDEAETAVRDALTERGFRVFCPIERVTRKVPSKRPGCAGWRLETADVPIFPNYLFVEADPGRRQWFAEIVGTRGVVRLLGAGGVPCVVPDAALAGLLELADSCGMIRAKDLTKNSSWFKAAVGDICAFIERSALPGVEGRITSLADLDRTGEITLAVNLLGGEQDIKVDHHLVASLAAHGQHARSGGHPAQL